MANVTKPFELQVCSFFPQPFSIFFFSIFLGSKDNMFNPISTLVFPCLLIFPGLTRLTQYLPRLPGDLVTSDAGCTPHLPLYGSWLTRLVHPRLEYAAVIGSPHQINHTNTQKSLQNRVVHFIVAMKALSVSLPRSPPLCFSARSTRRRISRRCLFHHIFYHQT